jgi:hypothetical protein
MRRYINDFSCTLTAETYEEVVIRAYLSPIPGQRCSEVGELAWQLHRTTAPDDST